jgi:hypothetical protein
MVEPHPYRFNGGQSTLLTLMQQLEKNLLPNQLFVGAQRDSFFKAISQINPPCDPNYGKALAALLTSSLAVSL